MIRIFAIAFFVGLVLFGGILGRSVKEPVILFEETFSDTSSPYWGQLVTDQAEHWISDGQYHIRLNVSDWSSSTYSVPAGRFRHFLLEVDVREHSDSSSGEFGLILRAQDNDNYYQLWISSDRCIGFDKYVEADHSVVVPLQLLEQMPQQQEEIHLRVVAKKNRFECHVNGTKAFDAMDSTFTDGYVGFFARSIDEPGVHVTFDNLVVRRVD
jgi:hypothetical protein